MNQVFFANVSMILSDGKGIGFLRRVAGISVKLQSTMNGKKLNLIYRNLPATVFLSRTHYTRTWREVI
jgi:hypothetical protein